MIVALKEEIENLQSSPNDGGDTGDIVGGNLDFDGDDDDLYLTATYYRPQYGCGNEGTTPQAVKAFVENEMKLVSVSGSDFIGLSGFEASTVIEADDDGYSYGMIGAMCRGDGPVNESTPIRLYYDQRAGLWTLLIHPLMSVNKNTRHPVHQLKLTWLRGTVVLMT